MNQSNSLKKLEILLNKINDKRSANIMGLAKVVVQCSADTFVVNQTLNLSINPDIYRANENPQLARYKTITRHYNKILR
ncbi:MAG: hypothetical protein CFE22_03845 [Cytophagaceae bacterium BCCC1]|nr:MAG: hypothetical protein CFE22_03845 [Cytophagaceae bacterium BCCC1]